MHVQGNDTRYTTYSGRSIVKVKDEDKITQTYSMTLILSLHGGIGNDLTVFQETIYHYASIWHPDELARIS